MWSSGYANVILADNPVAWWRLGESGGTVARDYCGGHDGTVFGGLTFGQAGCLTNDSSTSAYCNGTTGYIEVPWSADLNPAQYTVECWAKVMGGSGNYRSPLCSRDTGSDPDAGYMFYAQSGNNWGFWTGAGGTWNKLSGPTVGQNQWVHLAATSDTTTGNMVFYVNGTQVASVTNVTYQNLATPLRIGASATEGTPQFFFNGALQEVAVYNKLLSSGQALRHYETGLYGSLNLKAQSLGSNVILAWPTGTLQSATAVGGPYSDVAGALSPWTNSSSGPQMFFRIKL